MTRTLSVVGCTLLVLFAFTKGQNPGPQQQCGSYSGNTCNQVFESSAQVLTPSTGSSLVDVVIDAILAAARQNIGNDFTPQCENVATFVQCIQSYPPCMDRVWCSDLSENDIQQRIDASCQCSGNDRLCGPFVSSLRGLAGNLTNYHVTGQAPSGSTCQAATLVTSGASSNTGVTLIGSLITTILVTIGVVMF